MKLRIVLLEVSLLLGIVLSALLLPRNFPLAWFLAIAFSVEVAAHLFYFRANMAAVKPGGYKPGPKAYLAVGLIALYWLLTLLYERR